ncbi:hypothetical protein ACHAXH_009998 [Discostella pseudostelligera]
MQQYNRKIGVPPSSPRHNSKSVKSTDSVLSLIYHVTIGRLQSCIVAIFLLASWIGLQPILSLSSSGAGDGINQEKETSSSKKLDHHHLRTDHHLSFEILPNVCESPLHTRDAFDKVYTSGMWSNFRPLRKPADFYNNAHWPPGEMIRYSSSGEGSGRGPNTETSLAIILQAIDKYNVSSMIDIPCGDVNWIFDSYATDTLPVYIGLDITKDVIELNKQRFAHHVNKHFSLWDAISCDLPKIRDLSSESAAEDEEYKSVDLVHVRDVIQHLSLAQGVQYFCNIFRSGARVLITTSYNDETAANRDITESDWYKNNLLLEPFSFPETECVQTHPQHEADYTCVYDLTEDWVQKFVAEKCTS